MGRANCCVVSSNRNGACIAGPYAHKSTTSIAGAAAYQIHGREGRAGAFARAGSGFLVFMIPEVLQVIFENGYALRQGDVVVAQVRSDHRETEEHDQKNAARKQE